MNNKMRLGWTGGRKLVGKVGVWRYVQSGLLGYSLRMEVSRRH